MRWRLRSPDWGPIADRAADFLGRGPASPDSGRLLLKELDRRLLFCLRSSESWVLVKAFRFPSLRKKLRHRKGAWTEGVNLLLARDAGLPVPQLFGYGEARRWGLVRRSAVLMEYFDRHMPLMKLLRRRTQDRGSLIRRTFPLLAKLYHACAYHTDFPANNVLISPSNPQDDRIVDLQNLKWVDAPSLEVLLGQTARLYEIAARESIPQEDDWLSEVLSAAGVTDTPEVRGLWGEYLAGRLTRPKHLGFSPRRPPTGGITPGGRG
jgi:hypothetical protein